MPEKISVSVVIPAFNAVNSIGAAISSAWQQTQSPVEILVVDDGSTDSTASVAGAYPPPVSVLRRENGGPAAARKTAILQARGDLVALLDADDQFLPTHIERCVAVWRRHVAETGDKRVIVTGNAYRLTGAGLTTSTILPKPFPRPERQRERILQSNFSGNFVLYPRWLHEEIGHYDSEISHGEDRELWARAIYSGWQFVPQSVPNAIYRMGASSVSSDGERMATAERTILAKLRREFAATMTPAECEYIDLRLSMPAPRELVREANELIRASDWPEAEEHLRTAARLVPTDRRLRIRAHLARYRWARPLLSALLRRGDTKLGRIAL